MVFGFVLIFVLIYHQQPGNNSSVKVPVSPTAQYYPYISQLSQFITTVTTTDDRHGTKVLTRIHVHVEELEHRREIVE